MSSASRQWRSRSAESRHLAIRLKPRRYDDPDAAQLVAALHAEQVATYGFADPPDRDSAVDYEEPGGLFLVAYTAEGRPVACGGFRIFDDRDQVVEIRKMYVHPEWRGHGVGRHLLASLERRAAETGARKVLLETGERNAAALQLYTAMGYQPIPSYVHGRRAINRAFTKVLRIPRQAC